MIKKTIGIIGGMGPLATAKLFERIVTNSSAATDQEHPRVLIDNNTNIPDRTSFILGRGEDPAPELIKSAVGLEKMGADFLIMPCNTAHFFLKEISESIDIPFIDMLEETLKKASEAASDGRVGLLATDGTLQSGIYDKRAADHGLKLIHPEPEDQAKVMRFIYGIKSGNLNGHSEDFVEVVRKMADEGLKAVILGCTELSVAIDYIELDGRITYLDPLTIIARRALFESGCVPK